MASICVFDEETTALRRYKVAIFKIFDSWFTKLNSVLQNTMEPFVNEAFAVNLITRQVRDEKIFNSVIDEFKAGLELCKSVKEIQKRCVSFVEILEDLGGPARMAGKDLCQELQQVSGMYICIVWIILCFICTLHRKSRNFEFTW